MDFSDSIFWKLRNNKNKINTLPGGWFISEDQVSVTDIYHTIPYHTIPYHTPFTEGCDGVNYQTLPPGRSNMLYFNFRPLRSVRNSVQFNIYGKPITDLYHTELYHTDLYHTIPYHTHLDPALVVQEVSPRFIKGIYWATGLLLRTPFKERCAGANKKASSPGRHQDQASKQRGIVWYVARLSHYVQFSSVQPYAPGILSGDDVL